MSDARAAAYSMLAQNALETFASGVRMGLTELEQALILAFEAGILEERTRQAETRLRLLNEAGEQAPAIPRESYRPTAEEPTLKVEADKGVRLQHMLEAL